MAKIFRALLVAAVNTIKEFFAFATDNGESQVGDSVKLNDGMATSNYDWSAYPSDTEITGDYTQTGTIEKVKQIGDEFVYGMQEPTQDNKDVKIEAGQKYYAYTNENDSDDSVYTVNNPIKERKFNLENATVVGTLTENNGVYSGFVTSQKQYIIANNKFNYNADTWEIITKIKFNSLKNCFFVGSGYVGYEGNYSILLGINSSGSLWSLLGSGSSWFSETITSKTIEAGRYYWIKYYYTGTKYLIDVSTTGEFNGEEENYATVNDSRKVANTDNYIMWGTNPYSDNGSWSIDGEIDMNETFYITDNVTTTMGSFSTPSTLYENTGTTEFTPEPLESQPEFTIQEKGLKNAFVSGTLTDNNGVYSGFSNNDFINLGKNYKSQNNAIYEIRFMPVVSSNSGQQIINCEPLFNLDIIDGKLYTYNFGERQEKGGATLDLNIMYDAKITINNYNKIFELKKANEQSYATIWSGTDNGMSTTANTDIIIGDHSTLTDPSLIFSGSIDMNNTSITIDGQTTNFYDAKSGIIIENILYERNSGADETKSISGVSVAIDTVDNTTIQSVTIISDQTATIETSANVTSANNDMTITDGSYHLFNITIPTDMTSIIESAGISYQTNEMPLLLKSNTGVGFLLKDGNNAYYRNTWVITRDYDLHYQQINFSYPSGATVTCKVNNVLQNDLTPYAYAGDVISWTCDNAGTITTGTYTVKYSNLDGNIQTITIS